MGRKLLSAVALAMCAAGPLAHAQQPGAVQAPLELRFDISRYVVEGNSLLPQEAIDRAVQRFAGKQRDFGDVQRALEALEGQYRSRGYAAVQVYLPEQDLEKGEVTLKVIEARIRALEVRGNKFFSDANVRASLPSLQAGAAPNTDAIARNLRIANESPAKQTIVALRAGEKEGEVDAIVEVTDEDPRKAFVSLDNSGTGSTGYHRLGFGYQHSNLFDLDHALTLQYVTSPEYPRRVGIYSAAYHLPLYARGASMDFIAGFSDVDAGSTQTPVGPLAFSGRGYVYAARYAHVLPRLPGYEQRFILGIDRREYRNTCSLGTFGPAGCGTAAASFNLMPVSAGYSGSWLQQKGNAGFTVTASRNIPAGGGSTADLAQARFAAQADYSLYRLSAHVARVLPRDWQARARLDAQYTDHELVAPEQFGIGGASSVRGFLERERADDRGYSGSLELYTPEIASQLGWEQWSGRLLAFYDFGRTQRVRPLPGELAHNGISSAGVGLRLSWQKTFGLRLDVARILNTGGTREDSSTRVVFSTVWSF